jgi:hypothetical protein
MPSDFFHILHLRPGSAAPKLSAELKLLRDCLWGRSAHVRWRSRALDEIQDALSVTAGLVLLEWPSSAAQAAQALACHQAVRERDPTIPIIIIPDTDLPPVFGLEGLRSDSRLAVHSAQDFATRAMAEQTWDRLCSEFGISVPAARLKLPEETPDPDVAGLLRDVGRERLQLILQKFFPQAGHAAIYAVTGGWSGRRLCKAALEDDGELYYVKLFEDFTEYQRELSGHCRAEAWLGNFVASLIRIPDLGSDIEDQLQAFPAFAGSLHALCYRSASPVQHSRLTLEQLYRGDTDTAFLTKAVARLLRVLGLKQPMTVESRMPWNDPGGDGFQLEASLKRGVLRALGRLDQYLPALPKDGTGAPDTIRKLMYQPLSDWPSLHGQSLPVIVGPVHGDPNCRNCLVMPDHADDIQLIDCGGFSDRGRLVSDLAIIERDVKLLMMGTEPEMKPYFDLDIRQLSKWCTAEQEATQIGIDYQVRDAPAPSDKRYSAVARAYPLIGLVRERAKQLCPDDDSRGRHYFAALLYWTLETLKHEAIRPTKKLLALYSAAKILEAFSGPPLRS